MMKRIRESLSVVRASQRKAARYRRHIHIIEAKQAGMRDELARVVGEKELLKRAVRDAAIKLKRDTQLANREPLVSQALEKLTAAFETVTGLKPALPETGPVEEVG